MKSKELKKRLLIQKRIVIIQFGFLLILFVVFSFQLRSQTEWIKQFENPILELGSTGSWDGVFTQSCSVLFDGSIYHMWYGGSDGAHIRLGHATSPDGIDWAKDPLNPVLDLGSSGEWDDYHVYSPCVLLESGTYHLWYNGSDGTNERVGYATSSNGSEWNKHASNPVLDIGQPGSWDDFEVFPMAGSVIHTENGYKMWYGGGNTSSIYNIGYATSIDGITWDKHPTYVMSGSAGGSWDWLCVIPGTVLFDGSDYSLFYAGCSELFNWRIGLAHSDDGITWVEDPANPILDCGQIGSWDSQSVLDPLVFFDTNDELFKMWYTGGPFPSVRIGYAICSVTGLEEENNAEVVSHLQLKANPNPFSDKIAITFSTQEQDYVDLIISDQSGKVVQTLVSDHVPPGNNTFEWNAKGLTSGVYFCTLRSNRGIQTKKLIKLQQKY